ncbi:DNA helicase UvrD [Tenacibaculum holothuriorum]|uniref:DNA 3'-5' helicase n=1 Tax=Tenacibaculum holothuriorum TaxID=1635173 RepID=A0A1Y2PGY3_9FLAO|nr:DNA helicase UvrD [Tenacibaculum holothuriorum]
MQQPSTFQVYNASAGSGKTFTLVKEYLKVLLQSEDIFRFQKILAITFTNKAAGEMKERVLENLNAIAEGETTDILQLVLQETSIDRIVAQERSKKILDAILQNYSAFSITTIDSFTHKIIKSFAYDLGLSLNFEVEMDAVSLLGEAVDVLISKVGTDKEITKLLVNFSLDKADDDKSWDISRELNEFSRILLNEEDALRFRSLSEKSLQEFLSLKEKIYQANKTIDESFKKIGEEALGLLENNNLKVSDFAYSGECPKHFQKLLTFNSLKTDSLKFEGRIDKNFNENKKLYAAKASAEAKVTIDDVYDKLKELYIASKTLCEKTIGVYTLNKLTLKSIIPLAVLNNINNELTHIKEDNNLRLNAEFNQLISDNIKDQPAPFIYERIGQRFMHYFIDEMQDTSVLQWQNLIPLIDNALAQENSNLLLVGDGKQAIYRWRGGKAEQFINLGSEGDVSQNPFQVIKEVKELERNFRSYSEIIDFNNAFFQNTSRFFQNESYKNLFIEGNKQQTNDKKGGCVSISFLKKEEDKEEEQKKYPKKVLETVLKLQEQFLLNEICVLVRKKKDGVAVANYLAENGINIVSSETLLLQNNIKVTFIVNVMRVIQQVEDRETLLEVLYFLHSHLNIEEDRHSFISNHINKLPLQVFKELHVYNVSFDVLHFNQLPLYEKVEEIIRGFNLVNSSDAYIQFFLDLVLDQQRRGLGIQEFLEYWNDKKETLSIVAPDSSNAVQIMTIHKSKGLEFPVVIFPCDLDIYRQINPKVWLGDLPETYSGFNEMLLPFNKDIALINKTGSTLYEKQREELELDNFNLLYVALTRPVEQLHIITEYKLTKTGENTNFYSGIFINYLKEIGVWNDAELLYVFGDEKRVSVKEEKESTSIEQDKFISTSWNSHNINMLASASKLWDTEQGEAIVFGNLIHEMMSKIIIEDDIEIIVQEYQNKGEISTKEKEEIALIIQKIVNHPKLKQYFSSEVLIYNEREIVSVDGQIIIPDRLVISSNELTIIDYKTGKPSKKYHQQLLGYEKILQDIGFAVAKKLLVYVDEEILVEEV